MGGLDGRSFTSVRATKGQRAVATQAAGCIVGSFGGASGGSERAGSGREGSVRGFTSRLKASVLFFFFYVPYTVRVLSSLCWPGLHFDLRVIGGYKSSF